MARFWKEPYSLERALELGIHDFEDAPCVGVSNGEWTLTRDGSPAPANPGFRAWPKWIYYVEVCQFTFGFFSLEMIKEYLEFYSRRVLPSSLHSSAFSKGLAASVGDGQTRFERLPLRLRAESKRVRVVKVLEKALLIFGKDQLKNARPEGR
jgi:hypothetical protein